MSKNGRLLFDVLRPEMEARNFKWVRKDASFIRKEVHGFSALSIIDNLWHSEEEGIGVELEPIVRVRHDKVEDVFNQLDFIYGEEGRRYTDTVARVLCFYPFEEGKSDVQVIRKVAVEHDLPIAAQNILTMIDGHGEDFFRKYSSLLECSHGLNDPIREHADMLLNNSEQCAYRGIICAWFTERERVPTLEREWREYLKKAYPTGKSGIGSRAEGLRTVPERLDKLISILDAMAT